MEVRQGPPPASIRKGRRDTGSTAVTTYDCSEPGEAQVRATARGLVVQRFDGGAMISGLMTEVELLHRSERSN